jgi:Domain of unknown function (DUF3291)
MTDNATWHLAQYNIARLLAPLDDPLLADFVANLDRVNGLGDDSSGFVWRLQTDDGTSTSVRVRGDERIIVNFTVWESVESLFEFTYRSGHVEMYRRRREWFEHMAEAYLVLWWVPAGHIPSVEEADERLDHLRAHGPTEYAFTFKQRFDPPTEAPGVATSAPGPIGVRDTSDRP